MEGEGGENMMFAGKCKSFNENVDNDNNQSNNNNRNTPASTSVLAMGRMLF